MYAHKGDGDEVRTIRIGSGAGYSGDRIEPAIELAEKGDIQYLVFECLGERTVALAQQARMKNPESGYDPLLEERMRAVLPLCAAKGIKIVTNMGAANPEAAARKTADIAKSLGLSALKIASIVGDDVLDACKDGDLPIMEFDGTIRQLGNRLLSANAYLGAEPMAQALTAGDSRLLNHLHLLLHAHGAATILNRGLSFVPVVSHCFKSTTSS